MILRSYSSLNFLNPLIALLVLGFFVFVVLREQVPAFSVASASNVYIALLGVLSSALFILTVLGNRETYFPKKSWYFLVLFLVWFVIASFFSKDTSESVWEVTKLVSYGLIFWVIYNLFRGSIRAGNLLIATFVILGFLLLSFDLAKYLKSDFSKDNYFSGSFYWHNQMAGFLLFLLPLLLNFYVKTHYIILRVGLFIMVSISFFAMVLTNSRGGWLSILVVLPLFLVFAKNKMSYLKIGVAAFVVGFLATLFITKSEVTLEKAATIKQDVSSENRTVSGNLRATVWQSSFEMMRDFPIFGVGPGAFGSAYYKYQNIPWLWARDAHNHFLQFAAEVGVVGLFFFVVLILSWVQLLLMRWKMLDKDPRRPYLVGINVALFASIIHAVVDVDWSRISLFLLFWIFLAIAISSLNPGERKIIFSKVSRSFLLVPALFAVFSFSLLISEVNYLSASEKFYSGKFGEAERDLAKAVLLSKFDSRYYLLSGNLERQKRDQDAAKASFEKVTKFASFASEPYVKIAEVEIVDKDFEGAKSSLSRAIELAPYGNPTNYASLSDVYLRLRKYREAKEILERAIYESFPLTESFRGFEYLYDYTGFKKDLGWVYWRLVNVYIREGRKDEAKKLLATLEFDLDPQNPLLGLLKSDLAK